jgi:hypothetical protein
LLRRDVRNWHAAGDDVQGSGRQHVDVELPRLQLQLRLQLQRGKRVYLHQVGKWARVLPRLAVTFSDYGASTTSRTSTTMSPRTSA